MDIQELPVGFSMARFGDMDKTERQTWIRCAHGVDSEQEMRALVGHMMT